MHSPAKTLPAPASPGCASPVPLPMPIHGAHGHPGCPKPVFAQPAALYPPSCSHPVAGVKSGSSTGTILVLFILLVIISRSIPFGASASICRK